MLFCCFINLIGGLALYKFHGIAIEHSVLEADFRLATHCHKYADYMVHLEWVLILTRHSYDCIVVCSMFRF